MKAHFKFAHHILNILAELNTIFQAKYCFITDSWHYLVSLGEYLKKELLKFQNGDMSSFSFLSRVPIESSSQFETILIHLIINFGVRFYRPSFSQDKRSLKGFLDYDNAVVLPGAPHDVVDRCGLSPLTDIFFITNTTIPEHLSATWYRHGIYDEWQQFILLALFKKGDVIRNRLERDELVGSREQQIRSLLHMAQPQTCLTLSRLLGRKASPICGVFWFAC